MKNIKITILTLASFIFLISCKKNQEQISLKDPLVENRDTTVNPSDNFFRYANGNWFKNNPIPNSERSNGIFRTIQDTINAQIKKICEKSALDTKATKGSNAQKIGDFYASGMDTLTIEKLGLTPLKSDLERINSIKDLKDLSAAIAYFQTIGVSPAFGYYIGQDDKNSTQYAPMFYQGGLGMHNRDYYFNTDDETVNIRKEYIKHLQKMMELSGDDSIKAKNEALAIMKMETELAKNSRKLEALRDPIANYNKYSVQDFKLKNNNLDWNTMFSTLGLAKADSVIVGQPEFYTALNKMAKTYSLDDWKTYIKWNLLNRYATYLSKGFENQDFYFYATIMNGVKEQKPRWKRVVEETDGRLGELVGQIYISDYLPKGTKEKLLEIGNSVKAVYADHVKKLDWMSEPTKQKALKKLETMVMKVGYPDKWKDMSSVSIDRGHYLENIKKLNQWEFNYMVSKYGKPVDRNEWQMYPQTYNAYYNPSNNEIVVPACNIMVPGFEGRMPDDAVLYGIIGGSTFGHEITHAFDDQGSQYDEMGNLNNWWTEEDLKKFKEKTKLIVNQYNKYEPLKGKFLNGEATQGENIADLGGVIVGYEAFKKTPQYQKNQLISELNPDQRYFLSYAYAWMVNIKPEALAQQIILDVHSPAEFRINGPLANIPEFYKTFNIKEGSFMHQPDSLRVVIW